MIEFELSRALNDSYDWEKICQSAEFDLSQMREARKEKESNEAWRRLELFSIWRDYKNIFKALKARKYFKAWCEIEQVLISNKFLLENFPSEKCNTEFIVSHLISLQQLYPYRLFTSTVIEIEEEKCSICGAVISPWSRCDHRAGKLYNGELCVKEVSKMKLLGVDIVRDPEHKYAVIFPKSETGDKNDGYDYSLLEALIQNWQRPFQDWKVVREELYVPPSGSLMDTDLFPCHQSLKTYSDCCKHRPGILTYHYRIYP